MKKKQVLRHLLIVAALATLTAGCSDDNAGNPADHEPIAPDAGGIPVAFTADINPGSNPASADAHAGDPATRTVLTPDASTGGFTVTWKGKDKYAEDYDSIRIWAVNEENIWANNGNKKSYLPTTSAVSSALEPADAANKLTLPSAGNWKFMAVCGISYMSSGGKTSVSLSTQAQFEPGNTEAMATYDFSVATATQQVEADADMPAVSLRFEHKLSALQLNVTNSIGAELTIDKIHLSVVGEQIDYSRQYDLTTGKWIDEEKYDYLYLSTDLNFPALPATQSQTFHMLLFPGYAGKQMTITVITDRGEYAITKPAPDGGFEEGINYNVGLNVRTTDLTADETWTEYISTAAQLAAFRDRVNNGTTYEGQTVRLTADIDLKNEEWTPIGTGSFQGTFDGGGYHISGLNVNMTTTYVGLFGSVYNGTVRNLRVSGSVTTTQSYAGGIAGLLGGNSTVENCIFSGEVSSGSNTAGGIVGYINSSSARVAGCHTKGKVTATEKTAGGIAGENYGSIDGCYCEADVTVTGSGGSAGGIAGDCTRGTLTHCYATGSISGQSGVGGIVGDNYSSTLTGCIALNPRLTRTEGTETYFGRVAGYNNNGTYTSCAAFAGMEIADNADAPITPDADSESGDDLAADACFSADTYTSRGFTTDATDGAPGWAFDTASTWTYLPWNPAFASFPGIQPKDYRIAVPDYLKEVTQ